ncbi:MAG TPA: hypothetical protein VHT25_12810 [Solirubrobacteraceae bacterium]|nr:hypothetical protein [Solirubrobacteraceae bacterium]
MLASSVRAETSAVITAQLSSNRLRARGAVSVGIQFADPSMGLAAPVRRMVLRFPAGLALDLPHLRSCSPSRLRARGAEGCPAASALGRGHALVEAHTGSQTTAEDISLRVFLGPLRGLQPTIEIFGRGYTPFDKRVVLSGSLLADSRPYGERLVMPIPPIATLPLEPDASIVTFSLTVGAVKPHRKHDQNTVIVPSTCPLGGFPFAGEFAYADGSSGGALASIPCP